MALEQIIAETIQRSGPITFHDFMEMALYYPGLGYYTSDGDKIGTEGDFLTSCSYSSLFGKLLAVQLEEMNEKIAAPDFTIVEYGAGTGALSRDILTHFKKNNPALYNKLHYCIIEKSEAMRQGEKKMLGEKVTWHDNIKEIGPFTGCVISNELVDNFSVHQVVMQDELMEVFVGYENGFIELLKPGPSALIDYLAELGVNLPKGFRTEINLEAICWIEDIAAALDKGFLLTIDYGFSSAQLYSQCRSSGTLVCYHKHKVNDCPYSNIGNQDITAHVNFSALSHWGIKNGLRLNGFTNQACFMFGLGLTSQLAATSMETGTVNFLREFMLDMGTKLKVLVQQKNIGATSLMGLRFPQQLI
jgi:SAM-dependent MidA family methyltransferase